MPRLCRPERSISPRPVTATGRKAPVDGDARAGAAGRVAGAGVGGAAGHPEARAVGLDVGMAGRGEVLDGGSRYRRRTRRASWRSRGGEEQQPELCAVGQAGGREAPVRGDRSLGEGWRLERGQREHAGPGAGRSARHRSASVVSNAGAAASPSRFRSGSSTSPLPSRDRRRPRPPGSGSRGSRPLRGGAGRFHQVLHPPPRPCASTARPSGWPARTGPRRLTPPASPPYCMRRCSVFSCRPPFLRSDRRPGGHDQVQPTANRRRSRAER